MKNPDSSSIINWAKKYFLLLSVLFFLEGQAKALEPLKIDYFFEPGCRECKIISDTILPALSNAFNGKYLLNYRDVGIMTNYAVLARCQETTGLIKNEPVYFAIGEHLLFSGLVEIQSDFLAAVDKALHERIIDPEKNNRPIDLPALVKQRFQRLTLLGVLLAGLVDGINPCAISTLIFLVSVLVIAGFRHSQLIAVGAAYCLASFITYTAIGFGLFHCIHSLEGLPFVRRGLELTMAGILIALACLSFNDAWKYHLSRDPNSITIKLPRRIKLIMNSMMRLFSTTRHALFAAFVIGILVTLLETVCTGQVYVPTLVLIIKSGASPFLGLIYLLLYNLMFILPLVVVFGLILYGIKVQHLIDWSRQQVVKSKVIMACLFIALALVLILL
ncbi:MAG: hypothetical protein PHW60_10505 [Kiritimatiellae bacterium]|nr:hypothetical protein [Kiritimatiellia bacterium]